LDDSDLKAQEAQAQAAALTTEQNVTVTRVNLARMKDDLDRAAAQFKDNVIPKEQYDHARQALEAAQAQSDLAAAQVNNAKAQLNVVQTQLKNTRIFAATPGVVAKRWVLSGDVVQPGQPILTIYDLGDVWVRANLEETKIARIHLGDSVQVEIDAYAGRAFTGKVALIGSVAASQFSLIPPNNASGNFTKITQRIPVKIVLTDRPTGSEPLPLRPGMSAAIKIRVEGR
jgi:membrane fusion protein (multidrug efflux system)